MATISDKDIARAIYHSYKEKRGEDFFRKVVEFLERRRFLSRQKRILESLEKIINEEEFLVPSQSSNKKYKVTSINGWTCECPDFQKRCKEKAFRADHAGRQSRYGIHTTFQYLQKTSKDRLNVFQFFKTFENLFQIQNERVLVASK